MLPLLQHVLKIKVLKFKWTKEKIKCKEDLPASLNRYLAEIGYIVKKSKRLSKLLPSFNLTRSLLALPLAMALVSIAFD